MTTEKTNKTPRAVPKEEAKPEVKPEAKTEGKPEGKPEVRINGQLYRLRFDLYALEQIQEEFGGIRQALESMMDGSNTVGTVRALFRILANCQREYDGQREDVTGYEISKHESLAKLREVSQAIRAAIRKGNHSETADGGEASDRRENPLDKEYNEKNG